MPIAGWIDPLDRPTPWLRDDRGYEPLCITEPKPFAG